MIDQASLSASMGHARVRDGGRKVVGKPLLAVSAGGMVVVLATLCRGNWPEAVAAFVLTLGALQIMLHRALMQFASPPRRPQYGPTGDRQGADRPIP